MHPFWKPVIAPMLDALKAGTVVEIGAEQGRTTRLLCERAAETGGTVIAIDPQPLFDVSAWGLEWGRTLQVVPARSLDVVAQLPAADAVLIDGDHNYFTVSRELDEIASAAESRGQAPPTFFLHDVGWPYGRRDLYYDPESIPYEHRHDAARAALHPDRNEAGGPGVNGGLWNAISEGGPRNGVLTAVEDFLAGRPDQFVTALLPGWHGLAILIPAAAASRSEVKRELDRISSPGFLREWAGALERARILAGLESGPPKQRAEIREQIERDQGLLD